MLFKKKKLQRFKIYMSYSWCAPIFKISTGSILKNKSKWRQVYLEVHALVSLFFFETKNFNILSWVIMSNLISFCKKSFGFVCVQINAKITLCIRFSSSIIRWVHFHCKLQKMISLFKETTKQGSIITKYIAN